MKYPIILTIVLLFAFSADAQNLFRKKEKKAEPTIAKQLDSIYQSQNKRAETLANAYKKSGEIRSSDYESSQDNDYTATNDKQTDQPTPPEYRNDSCPKEVQILPVVAKGNRYNIDDIISRHLIGEDVSNLPIAPFEVYFNTGSATLALTAEYRLNELCFIMRRQPILTVHVAGFTDSIGTSNGNQTLSERRASAVVDFLMARGIDYRRIKVSAFGETHPVASNDTEKGRQLNRRTWIVVE